MNGRFETHSRTSPAGMRLLAVAAVLGAHADPRRLAGARDQTVRANSRPASVSRFGADAGCTVGLSAAGATCTEPHGRGRSRLDHRHDRGRCRRRSSRGRRGRRRGGHGDRGRRRGDRRHRRRDGRLRSGFGRARRRHPLTVAGLNHQGHREERHAEDEQEGQADEHRAAASAAPARLARRGRRRHRHARDERNLARIVERQRLVGRLAERLTVGADEPPGEDGRGQCVVGVGFQRLEIRGTRRGSPGRSLRGRLPAATAAPADRRRPTPCDRSSPSLDLSLHDHAARRTPAAATAAARFTETSLESPGSSIVTP